MNQIDYWKEVIRGALSEVDIVATEDQIAIIASNLTICHDQYNMVMGYDVADANLSANHRNELQRLRTELELEKQKRICRKCNGTGTIRECGPCHGSETKCSDCGGEGKRI